jgi:NodT family efflux transporter outer membrane factor (OMF) lipoprotein
MYKLTGSAALIAATCLLSACAVGPDFEHPSVPEVTRYTPEKLPDTTSLTDTRNGRAQRFVSGKDIAGEWWRMFGSPGINSLVIKSLAANPTLQAALASLRNARENVYAQQGKYFPLVQGNVNATRQLTAAALSSPLNSGANLFSLYTAQVLVTYTFDIWGLNRRTVESLQGQADYQRLQAEAAYLTLTSNVVVAAIQEASLRGQIDATNELIAINEKMLGNLREKFQAGAIARSDVAAQEAAVAQTRATLPPLRKALAQQRDLLAALAGRFPSQEPPETFKLAALRLPADLPVSLPSQLVEQRPDVRAATEQLHSASANVGVAIANMLPQLTLNGGAGSTGSDLATLFTPAGVFWQITGNATQTLFDGFTLLHEKRAAEAAYEETLAQYRSTVIGAFQNVADSLRAIQNDADALKAASDFERAAKISRDLAQEQINLGNADVLLLLNAQLTYQQAIIGLVQAEANRLSDTAALIQALGGGWWNRTDVPSDAGQNALTTLVSGASSANPK